jgi:hypothetical protein
MSHKSVNLGYYHLQDGCHFGCWHGLLLGLLVGAVLFKSFTINVTAKGLGTWGWLVMQWLMLWFTFGNTLESCITS